MDISDKDTVMIKKILKDFINISQEQYKFLYEFSKGKNVAPPDFSKYNLVNIETLQYRINEFQSEISKSGGVAPRGRKKKQKIDPQNDPHRQRIAVTPIVRIDTDNPQVPVVETVPEMAPRIGHTNPYEIALDGMMNVARSTARGTTHVAKATARGVRRVSETSFNIIRRVIYERPIVRVIRDENIHNDTGADSVSEIQFRDAVVNCLIGVFGYPSIPQFMLTGELSEINMYIRLYECVGGPMLPSTKIAVFVIGMIVLKASHRIASLNCVNQRIIKLRHFYDKFTTSFTNIIYHTGRRIHEYATSSNPMGIAETLAYTSAIQMRRDIAVMQRPNPNEEVAHFEPLNIFYGLFSNIASVSINNSGIIVFLFNLIASQNRGNVLLSSALIEMSLTDIYNIITDAIGNFGINYNIGVLLSILGSFVVDRLLTATDHDANARNRIASIQREVSVMNAENERLQALATRNVILHPIQRNAIFNRDLRGFTEAVGPIIQECITQMRNFVPTLQNPAPVAPNVQNIVDRVVENIINGAPNNLDGAPVVRVPAVRAPVVPAVRAPVVPVPVPVARIPVVPVPAPVARAPVIPAPAPVARIPVVPVERELNEDEQNEQDLLEMNQGKNLLLRR